MHELNFIGKNIRDIRSKLGITQKELASELDLSSNYICQVETGRKVPALRTLSKIAIFFNVQLSDIISGDPLENYLKDFLNAESKESLQDDLKYLMSLLDSKD